ncbi:MAG: hypothetical protein ACI8P7_001317 [Candidatus Azotimanducaceae bacterium]|jgi:hypothetical protein
MREFGILILTILFFNSCSLNSEYEVDENAGINEFQTQETLGPNDFFSFKKPKVLVAGTFHFNYPGQDAHKVSEENKVDVLSEQGIKQVNELVDYIKKFNPTKIGIEALPNNNYTNKLHNYVAGTPLGRDEREQLGLRIAKELNLDTIYSMDDGTLFNDLMQQNPEFCSALMEDYDFNSTGSLDSIKNEWYTYKDSVFKDLNLLDRLILMNSKEYHQFDYGTYLIGDFKLGDNRGADMLASYWYDRNLRIFRNMQQIVTSEEDRILLIFGNAHAALLRQFLTCSPEFEYVEFSDLN